MHNFTFYTCGSVEPHIKRDVDMRGYTYVSVNGWAVRPVNPRENLGLCLTTGAGSISRDQSYPYTVASAVPCRESLTH